MPRYFIRLSYNGTNYCGWQRQNNALSVQQSIEDNLTKIYNREVSITGCGRTDAGVHAKNFIAHLDMEADLLPDLRYKINRMLKHDIVIHQIAQVDDQFHARFDATIRSYEYVIKPIKDPFVNDLYYHYKPIHNVDLSRLQTAAKLIMEYNEFFPFCKSNSDAQTMKCEISESYWEVSDDKTEYRYNITANRFLRGMVRLIVGMCINVGLAKVPLDHVRQALDTQQRLDTPWSVPACGLFLNKVGYPIDLSGDK